MSDSDLLGFPNNHTLDGNADVFAVAEKTSLRAEMRLCLRIDHAEGRRRPLRQYQANPAGFKNPNGICWN